MGGEQLLCPGDADGLEIRVATRACERETPGQPRFVSYSSQPPGRRGRSTIPGPFRVLREGKRWGSVELSGGVRGSRRG